MQAGVKQTMLWPWRLETLLWPKIKGVCLRQLEDDRPGVVRGAWWWRAAVTFRFFADLVRLGIYYFTQ